MSDAPPPTPRTCEWCGSPMASGGRAVCPACGRLASRLAAMDTPPAATTPPKATAPPPPPAAPPAPGAAPAPPAPDPPTPGPVAPGDRWPAPAPLPPEETARPWWRLVVPAAAIVLVVIIGAVLVAGRGDDGDAAAPVPTSSVDISDLDDPATAPPKPTTTTATTAVTADGRYVVASPSGIEWSMGAAPEIDDLVSDASPDPVGQLWQADVDDETTEVVEITDLGGAAFDAEAAIAAATSPFDGQLAALEESHIAEASGQTTSFTGTLGGQPVVGYVVAAAVGDQSLVAMTFREGDDLEGLYLDFLALPSTFDLP